MIDFYNSELDRYNSSDVKNHQPSNLSEAEKYVAHFVNKDSKKIAWSRDYRYDLCRSTYKKLATDRIITSLYRPYTKTNCFYDLQIAMELYQLPKIFPEHDIENLVIATSSIGSKTFSTLISRYIQDLHTLESASQCFPLYLYEQVNNQANNLLSDIDGTDATIITAPSGKQYKRTDAITDAGLKHFTDYYKDSTITKEDLFYYIYGILHNEEYKAKYANNLTKSLPHIPRVANISDFRAYVSAGRALAHLHINYEQIEAYNVKFEQDMNTLSSDDYAVVKMKFADKKDKSIIIYNSKITISHIPVRAYKYIVNGKSAIEWVMERQSILQDKDSGITNNANDWANETMNNPKYPLELLLRVITVSLKTLDIVDGLPELDI